MAGSAAGIVFQPPLPAAPGGGGGSSSSSGGSAWGPHPTEYAYCDWMVNVNDCPNSGVFRTVKAASAVLSFVAVALLAAYMFKRRRHVRVQGLEAVDGTLLVFAFGFSIVQLADAYPDYIVRYIVMELGYVSMLDGLVFFLYALSHSIPISYMDSTGSIRSSLITKRWILLLFCGFQWVMSFLAGMVTGIQLGYLVETSGLRNVDYVYKFQFVCWSILTFNCLLFCWYVSYRLAVIVKLRDNRGNVHNDVQHSIKRVKVFAYLITALLVLLTFCLILACLYREEVFMNLIPSVLTELSADISIQATLIVITFGLLRLEYKREKQDQAEPRRGIDYDMLRQPQAFIEPQQPSLEFVSTVFIGRPSIAQRASEVFFINDRRPSTITTPAAAASIDQSVVITVNKSRDHVPAASTPQPAAAAAAIDHSATAGPVAPPVSVVSIAVQS